MKKASILNIIKLVLLCAIAFLLYKSNVAQLFENWYLEIQKAAYEGKDVRQYISAVLKLGSMSLLLLAVLLFICSSHSKPALLFNFLFILILLTGILAFLNTVYKDEIANYLKSTYQPEAHVTETK